ncbi:hypothetical protein AAHC03_026653 [Spirometra sp. Aus1]
MTRQFQVYLDRNDSTVTYSCVHCRAHLADYRDLISKSFQGSQGRAYLFDKIVNVKSAPAEDRLLLTGHHRVADIHCVCCGTLLGWKYEKAFEPSQRYKEGKYIIELIHIIKDNQWDASLTPKTKRRSSGYSTDPVDTEGVSPLSQDVGGQRNGGFLDSSADFSEEAFPSWSQSGSLSSGLLNPALLSSTFTELEESGPVSPNEPPSGVIPGQQQQAEHLESVFIQHADFIPEPIQQSDSAQGNDDGDVSHQRSSIRDLDISHAVETHIPSHLSLVNPQKTPSRPKKYKSRHCGIASIGGTLCLASSSSSCTLTEPLLEADTADPTVEPELDVSFLPTVSDNPSEPNRRSSGGPSESHQPTIPLLSPSDSVLTLLTEVVSPSGDLPDHREQLQGETFSAFER